MRRFTTNFMRHAMQYLAIYEVHRQRLRGRNIKLKKTSFGAYLPTLVLSRTTRSGPLSEISRTPISTIQQINPCVLRMIILKQFRRPHTRGGGEVLHPQPPPICVKVTELLHTARPIPECGLIALGGGGTPI